MKLDHCVLPTASLAVARERLSSLGFTVAPDAAHPFGTANCCVFFQDGTYLEPLAIGDEKAAREAAAGGNTFVERDRTFREACGQEGFSALVVSSKDAAADHARFLEEGISAGPPLSFSRPFTGADGLRAEASFRLAFAAPASSASFFFACERVKMPAGDRSSLQRHENGVSRIARIIATMEEPEAGEGFFNRLFRKGPAGGVWSLSTASLSLLTPAEAGRAYGIDAGNGGSLGLGGIVFRADSVDEIAARLAVAEIAHTMHRGRLVVPPAPGQGAYFIFEEPGSSAS